MTLQFDGFSPSALTGLERVEMQGWPYHGAIHIVHEADGSAPIGTLRRAYAVGQPQSMVSSGESDYLRAYPGRDGYGSHVLRYHGAPQDWEYYFGNTWYELGVAREQTEGGSVSHLVAGDCFGAVSKNTARWASGIVPKHNTGVPLQNGGVVCRVDLQVSRRDASILWLRDMTSTDMRARRIQMPISPNENIRYAWPLSGNGTRPGLLFSFAETAALPPLAASSVYATRIHDVHENKMIVSVGLDSYGYSVSGYGGVPYVLSASSSAYGSYTSGSPSLMSAKHGWQPFAFYEVSLNGSDFNDVTVTELFNWQETAGSVHRETTGEEAATGDLLLEARQLNCVIDAYYDASGNVQSVRGDFDFRCESHRYEYDEFGNLPINKHLYYRKIEYSLKHKVGVQEREVSFFQEITKSSRYAHHHLEKINGDVTVDVERQEIWPMTFSSNSVFDRCPYPGSELRALNMPCIYYNVIDPETDEVLLRMTPLYTLASVSSRHCNSLSLSADSGAGLGGQNDYYTANTKSLRNWSVISKTGILDMPDKELPEGYYENINPSMYYMCPGFFGHPYLTSPVNEATGQPVLSSIYNYDVVTMHI